MKSGCLARALTCAVLVPVPALADVPGEELIVVTASRTAGLDALGGVSLERERLLSLAPVTALDALDRVAGVRAYAKSGAAGPSFLSIRGGEPNFTLVLIEGAKVTDSNNSAGGAFDFAQIDPALLDRIEVYRGALSAVHGSDALSGVVNLRLREARPGERSGSARLITSTEGEVGGDASLRLGWAEGGLLLGGGAYDSGGLDAGADFARQQGLARLTQQAGGARIEALALHAESRRLGYPEDGGGPELAQSDALEDRDTAFTLISLSAAPADEAARLAPAARLSWSRQDSRADTPAIAPGVLSGVPAIVADSRFERLEAAASLGWRRGPVRLAAGMSYLDEEGRGTGSVDFGFPLPADFRIGRALLSRFAEGTLASGPVEATVSLRYDDPTGERGEWTPRAALRLTPREGGPTIGASYAEGFKLPSLYALAYPLIANPDLRPERATSYEAFAEQRWLAGRVRLAWFRTDYRDLIDFDAERFINVNRAEVRAQGIEAEGAVRLGDFALAAALTYLDVDSREGPPLRARPEWTGNLRLDWAPADRPFSAFGELRSVDERFELSVPTGQVTLEAYTTLDAGGSWRLSERVRAEAVLRNLTGADYEESVGFPAPGRLLRLSLSAAF